MLIVLIPKFSDAATISGSQTFTLDGKLLDSSGTNALLDASIVIDIKIYNPASTCILYEESQTVNTTSTDGRFTILVGSQTGSSKRTGVDVGNPMVSIFQNNSPIAGSCGSYTPVSGDTRLMRVTVSPSTTGTVEVLTPDTTLDQVPSALVAESLQGLDRDHVLAIDPTSTSFNQSTVGNIFSTTNYPILTSLLSGTNSQYVKSSSNGAIIPSVSGTPSSTAAGQIWYNSSANSFQYYNGTSIQTVGAAGSGISSLTVGSSMTAGGVVGGTLTSPGTIDIVNSGVTAGAYPKLTVNSKGLVTYGTALIESDIPTLTSPGHVSGNTITSGVISGTTSINSSGNISVPMVSSGIDLTRQIQLFDPAAGSSHRITISAPTLTQDYSLVFPATAGTAGYALTTDGSGILSWASSSAGSVTSVGLSLPSNLFSVTTPTVTSSGTLTAALAHQNANLVFAGPSSGSAAAPTFRALTASDIPAAYDATILKTALNAGQIWVGNASNSAGAVTPFGDVTLSIAGSGTVTGLQGYPVSNVGPTIAGQMLRWNGSAWAPNFVAMTDLRSSITGANSFASSCAENQTLTYNSVGDTMSCSNISVASSQVTWNSTGANLVFASPNGSAGLPVFRGIATADLPLSGVSTGSYSGLTVDSYGRVTNATALTTLLGYGIADAVKNLGGSPAMQSGVDGSKPSSPLSGTVYFAIDTKTIYEYSSGNWLQLASNAGSGGTLTSLIGDVTTTGSGNATASVVLVGGSSANAVHTAELLANAATSANTASTIVKRDASGNFTAATASLTSANVNSVVYKGGSNTVTVSVSPSISSSYSIVWPQTNGLSNQVMQTDGSGNLSWMTPSSVATSYSGVLPVGNGGTGTSIPPTEYGVIYASTSSGYASTVAGTLGYPLLGNGLSGAPSFGPLPLSTSVTGLLSVANGGTNASSTSQGFIFAGPIAASGAPTFRAIASTDLPANAYDSTYFRLGGNAFTAPAILGTTDANSLTLNTASSTRLTITSSGNIGVGVTSPTSRFMLPAGTALAGTSPLKLISGTVMTTPEPGAVEFDGTSLYYTDNGSVRHALQASGTGIAQLLGDVTASGNGSVSATVQFVGGSLANAVHTAEILANNATNLNTANQIVKRDASGSFIAGTANLTSASVNSVVYRDSGSNTVTVSAPTSVTSSYAVRWPASTGLSSQVMQTDGSGNLSWMTPSSVATSYSGVLPIGNGGTGTSAPPNQFGVIFASTSSGYASTTAGTNGYPFLANSGAAPSFQQLSLSGSGVSGLLPVAAGGTNAATASAGYIFAGPTSGGAAAPSFRAIAASDLPAGTSSQWITSGSTINYLLGSVGIGTAAPQGQLDVYGTGLSSAMVVPRDSSANRPNGINGMLRYNTTINQLESYTNGAWAGVAASGNGISAIIGDVIASGNGSASSVVARVNGVTYPSLPLVNTVPVVTGTGVVTYEPIPNAALANYSSTIGSTVLTLGGTANSVSGLASLGLGVNGTTTGLLNLSNGLTGGATTTLQASPSTLSAWSLTLPASAGSMGSYLQTNGSGVTSWVIPSGNGTVQSGFSNQLAFYSTAGTVVSGLTSSNSSVLLTNGIGVPSWNSSANDNFSQYALLSGRAGGQIFYGGSGASENATISSTSNATKGFILLQPTGGNVGIGTSAPGALLDIASSSTGGTIERLTNSDSGGRIWSFISSGSGNLGGAGQFGIHDTTLGFRRFTIDTAGNVGIGTAAPQSILDVYGTGQQSAVLVPRDTSANRPSTGINGMLRYNVTINQLETYSSGAWNGLATSASIGGNYLLLSGGTLSGNLLTANGTNTAPSVSFSSDATTGIYLASTGTLGFSAASGQKMTISNSGVGIGTSSATSNLQIDGSSNPTISLTNSLANYFTFGGVTTSGTFSSQSQVGDAVLRISSGNTIIANQSGGNISLTTGTSQANDTSKLSILTSGLIGIGTNSPQAQLDIYSSGLNSAVIIPRDSTANRPSTAVNGMVRYNTSLSQMEIYSSGLWGSVVTATSVSGSYLPLSGGTLTGVVSYPLGSVTAPSINFGDTTSGFYSPGVGSLAATTSGTPRLTINSTGLGIGTATPAYPLDVYSTVNASATSAYGTNQYTYITGNKTFTTINGAYFNTNNQQVSSATTINGLSSNLSNSSQGITVNAGNFFVQNSTSYPTNTNGIAASANQASGGTISNLTGGNFSANVLTGNGSATVTSATGVSALVTAQSGEAITNAYGLYSSITNAGTITNAYGIYLAPVSGTSKYGVYEASGGVNYFAGNVGIGTNSPQSLLDIYGTGTSSAIIVPRATIAQRPTTAINGMIRYQIDNQTLEAFTNGVWSTLSTSTSAANQWTASGSNLYYASGSVGIGTTAPSSLFDIYQNTSSDLTAKIESVYSGKAANLLTYANSLYSTHEFQGVTGGDWKIGLWGTTNFVAFDPVSNTFPLQIEKASPTGSIYLKSTGSVGIGITSPVSKLDVNGSISAGAYAGVNVAPSNGLIISGSVGIGTASPQAILDINALGTGQSAIIVPRDSTANRPGGINGMLRYNTSVNQLETFSSGAWSGVATSAASGATSQWTTSGTTIYYNGGNVGIGTNAPGNSFQVNGSSAPSINLTNGTIGYWLLGGVTTAGNYSSIGALGDSVLRSNSGNSIFSNQSGGNIIFATGTSITNDSAKMTISSAGLIGIGTSSPNTGVDVWGSANYGIMEIVGNGVNVESSIGFRSSNIGRGSNYGLWVEGTNVGPSAPVGSFGLYSVGLGANVLTMSSSGNVGVGAVSAQALLDVAGSGTNSAIIVPRATIAQRPAIPVNGMIRYQVDSNVLEAFVSGAWASILTGSGVNYLPLNGGTMTGAIVHSNGSVSAPSIALADGTSGIYGSGASNITMVTGGIARLAVNSSGNVGIGTTTPVSMLNVHGGAIISDGQSSSGQCVNFSTGNMQVSSYSTTNAISIGGLNDGGAYTLVLTGYSSGQVVTVNGYTDSGCSIAIATGVDFGGSSSAITSSFTSTGNTQLITFIYSAVQGVAYASASTGFFH